MSDQKQGGGLFSSFRRNSRRASQEEEEPSPHPSDANLSAHGENLGEYSYGSLSNESITDAELGAATTSSSTIGDMILSPQSSATESRASSGRALTVMSPLMGEALLDTEDEGSLEQEEAGLLPMPPPKLNLPPTVPRSGGSSAQPVKAYPEVYQTVGTPRGAVGANGPGPGESPSSVNAQPGDWHGVRLNYGTGGGGGAAGDDEAKELLGNGTTNTGDAAPSIWSCFSGGSNKNRPFAAGVRIIVILALTILTALLATIISNSKGSWWSSNSGAASGSSSGSSVPSKLVVPYPHVDRAAYGDPAEKIVDPDLFDPRLLGTASPSNNSTRRRLQQASSSPVKDIPSTSSLLKVPFPTGAFWTNFVLKPTTDQGLSYPIFAYPYGYKWSPTKLVTSYPPLRRKVDATSIRDVFNPDLTFGSEETVAMRHVVSFDPLSVSVRFLISDHKDRSNYWESYIVRGSPYVTIKYRAATPVINPLSIFKSVMCPRDDSGRYNNAPARTKAQIEKGEGSTSGNGTRTLDGDSWGVCSSSTSGGNSPIVSLTGVQFLIRTQENLTWLVFASSPITLVYDGAGKRTVKASQPFTGVLRFALVPPPADDSGVTGTGFSGIHDGVQLSKSSGVKRLIYHASVYPVAGHVTWEFQKEESSTGKSVNQAISGLVGISGNVGDIISSSSSIISSKTTDNRSAKVKFVFDTLSMSDTSQGSADRSSIYSQLLILALPHHAEQMGSNILKKEQFDLEYHCIKGKMQPVTGDSWEYVETLPTLGFDDDDALQQISSMDGSVRRRILDQVKKDLVRVLPTFDENVYGFGKQIARLAQLVHISHMLSSPSGSGDDNKHKKAQRNTPHDTADFVQEGLDSLRKLLCTFLRDGQKDKLMFDSQFGGMVTKDGLEDTQADFGNGRFNDHHFHYGYLLYASAILGKYDPPFVNDYGPYVDSLMFDVAYSSNSESGSSDDNFFPFTRHINWYDGHSFASGLFPYGNGKSQESSSEAVNCYYGAYLWSKVRFGDSGGVEASNSNGGTDFARLLLSMEVRGAQTYWHMMPEKTDLTSFGGPALRVYNNEFSKNYMVGNLGMLDAVCSTWFGTNKLYVHMINFVPLTAITGVLFDETYVKEEFANVISKLYGGVEMAWKGYVVGDRAIIDPNGAWEDALKVISYELDAALSLSQLLYFISTRKGFSVSGSSNSGNTLPNTDTTSGSDSSSSSSACEVHPACVDLGLSGKCCPTVAGLHLGCCESTASSDDAGNKDTGASRDASACEAHSSCIDLGLSGECCPTADGSMLGCCGGNAGNTTQEKSAPSPGPKPAPASKSGGTGGKSADCSSSSECSDAGLTGNCCPTDAGEFLGCCDT